MKRRVLYAAPVVYMAMSGLAHPQAPSGEAVTRAAADAAAYLVRSTGEDGRLRYRVSLNPQVEPASDYNVLRHAGTVYAMSAYYREYPDEAMRLAILRAAGYLRDRVIREMPEKPGMLAVWSVPELTGRDRPLRAKLGGTGLGLVALVSVEGIQPGFTALSRLRALARFLLYMQKGDGSFFSLYIPSEGGRQDEWRSLFYPGEAALGLLMLYEYDRSDAWLAAGYKALYHVARRRQHFSEVPTDHWALLATAKLFSLRTGWVSPPSKALLVDHAVRICEAMLREQLDDSQPPHLRGGFSAAGETIPTATYLEGLQAALTFLPQGHPIRPRVQSAVQRGIAFLLSAQIRQGELAGAFPQASLAGIVDKEREARPADRAATEVRIDYTQHALSALVEYLRLAAAGDLPAAGGATTAAPFATSTSSKSGR
jgi:hypothetical protein